MVQQNLNIGLSREQIRAAVQADFVELYAALNSAYGTNLVPRLLNSGLSDSQVLDFTRANFADLYAAVKAQGLTGAPRYLNAGLSSDQLRAATQANFTDLYTLLGAANSDPLAQFDNLSGDWSGGDLSVRRNVWQFTEDVASNRYIAQSGSKGTDTLVRNGVTLTRMTWANFYASLRSQVAGVGATPFVTGGRYLLSYFIYNPNAAEVFFWPRPLAFSTSYGHGGRLMTGRLRRVWYLAQANSTSKLDFLPDPTVDLGSGSDQDAWWIQTGNATAVDFYLGGFQIERVTPDTYDDGVALIGDSTMQGGSGSLDYPTSFEVSRWIEALLNVKVFNRGVAGQRTDQMDARWATDITPLARLCNYAIIQGGVNDFTQGIALGTVQANVESMEAKAVVDGLLPVFMTCTPSVNITSGNEINRKSFNTWLKANKAKVLDIASVVDPANSGSLLPQYLGDGTHYGASGKRAIGIYCAATASAPFWSFTRPTPYQKVTASTYP